MTAIMAGILLALAVLSVWIGCIGFLRLRDGLDRLHAVAFINVTANVTLALSAILSDGISTRSLKIVMIAGLMLLGGAAGAHVTGRALLQRAKP